MTPDLWEMVFYHAHLRLPDKDDSLVYTAEGKVGRQFFRIVYGVDDDTIIPLSIIPIARRGLRGNTP